MILHLTYWIKLSIKVLVNLPVTTLFLSYTDVIGLPCTGMSCTVLPEHAPILGESIILPLPQFSTFSPLLTCYYTHQHIDLGIIQKLLSSFVSLCIIFFRVPETENWVPGVLQYSFYLDVISKADYNFFHMLLCISMFSVPWLYALPCQHCSRILKRLDRYRDRTGLGGQMQTSEISIDVTCWSVWTNWAKWPVSTLYVYKKEN